MRTPTRLFWRKKEGSFNVWDNISNAETVRSEETFPQGVFQPYNHVCIFVLFHRLLDYAEIFRLKPILSRWRSIPWGYSATLHCGVPEEKLPSFLNARLNCIFADASFEIITNLSTVISEKWQGFYGTLQYNYYTTVSFICSWTPRLLFVYGLYRHLSMFFFSAAAWAKLSLRRRSI